FRIGARRRIGVFGEQAAGLGEFQRGDINELAQRGNAQGAAQRIQPVQLTGQTREGGVMQLEAALIQRGEAQFGQGGSPSGGWNGEIHVTWSGRGWLTGERMRRSGWCGAGAAQPGLLRSPIAARSPLLRKTQLELFPAWLACIGPLPAVGAATSPRLACNARPFPSSSFAPYFYPRTPHPPNSPGSTRLLPPAPQRPVQAHRRLQPGGALLHQAVLALEIRALGVEQILQGDGAGLVAGLGQFEGEFGFGCCCLLQLILLPCLVQRAEGSVGVDQGVEDDPLVTDQRFLLAGFADVDLGA